MGKWWTAGSVGRDSKPSSKSRKGKLCKQCKFYNAEIGDLCMGCRQQRGGR